MLLGLVVMVLRCKYFGTMNRWQRITRVLLRTAALWGAPPRYPPVFFPPELFSLMYPFTRLIAPPEEEADDEDEDAEEQEGEDGEAQG